MFAVGHNLALKVLDLCVGRLQPAGQHVLLSVCLLQLAGQVNVLGLQLRLVRAEDGVISEDRAVSVTKPCCTM